MENQEKQSDETKYGYQTGIEEELNDAESNDPFNPEDISINSKVVPMETCLRRILQKTINLNPDFQRSEVWTPDKKSQLIESLMLKIPLPMFYVSSDEQGNYTVVDGLQRLSTIRSFILGDEFLSTRDEKRRGEGFKLQDIEFWKEYNGRRFNELPTHLKNRILETEFNFTIIEPGTPEEVKRNIFKRINTGGLPLSTQEIRNALYIGKSTEILKKLASCDEFFQATDRSIRSLRMEDKELILRFLAFVVRDYTTYRKTVNVDTFLSETMIIMNAFPDFKTREFKKLVDKGDIKFEDISISNLESIESLFRKAMTRAYKLFGIHSFRKSYPGKRRTPINKSLFEMWGALLSKLTEPEYSHLLNNKNEFMEEYKKIINDDNFGIAISRDSMKHYSVKDRFDKILNLINRYRA